MPPGSSFLLNSVLKRWGFVVVGLLAMVFVSAVGKRGVVRVMQTLKGRSTVAERVTQFGPGVRDRLRPRFAELQIPYPPRAVAMLGFKQERVLELWVSADAAKFSLLRASAFSRSLHLQLASHGPEFPVTNPTDIPSRSHRTLPLGSRLPPPFGHSSLVDSPLEAVFFRSLFI